MKNPAFLACGMLALLPLEAMAAERHPALPGAVRAQPVVASPYDNSVVPLERDAPDPSWARPAAATPATAAPPPAPTGDAAAGSAGGAP
jgi:hypothetical protein